MTIDHATERIPLASVRDLVQIGEELPFHVMDALDRRLLAQGQRIGSERQFELLFERGAWVQSEVVKQLRQERAALGKPLITVATRKLGLVDRWEQLVWSLDGHLRQLLRGMPVADELCDLGDSLMALVDRDVDVALFMTIRHNEPRFALYALLHAIHTATVAQILARQLDWPEARVARLVRAALTMNASMLELQATLAMQRDPPSAKQRQQIHDHPTQSARLLRAAGVTDETWLEAVEQHHERSGGGGYPAGLQAVGEIAHALRTADVFTAKISERAFRAALPVQSAVRQLFDEEKGGAMAAGLIRALGLYPPGDLVQLKNGELAVVTRRGPTATTPMAAAISDSRGKLTVATPVRDTRQPEFAIAGAAKELPPHLRVLPERVYGWLDA